MDRVLQSTASTIAATFHLDGVPTNPSPDSATVEIVRADGTVLVAETAATNDPAADGRFTYPLSKVQTAELDRLTARWDSNLGTVETTVEVAGGFVFSLAQARAVNPLGDAVKYPAAKLIAMRTVVETALEDVCDVAFVPRYERETVSGDGALQTRLRWQKVRTVRDAIVDGAALTGPQLAETVAVGATAHYPSGWAAGVGNVTIGYEHGHSYPPPRVSQAAVLLTKRWLLDGPADDRATSMSTEDGTFSLVTPGMRGALFDIPEVNAVINAYGLEVVVG